MSGNRRIEERHPAVVRVTYQSPGEIGAEYTQNISSGGLFVVTNEPLELGQHLELQLWCAGLDQHIPVPGEVRWVGEKGDPPQKGVGVRFQLDDPGVRAHIEAMVSAITEPLAPAVTGGQFEILLVDPNQHATNLFTEGLQRMAERHFEVADYFKTTVVHDGEEALSVLEGASFALAIIELNTPEVDGAELIRRLQSQAHPPPICAIARPFPGDRSSAQTAGADMFLHKPIQLKALFNTVCVMLKLQAAAETATS